MKLTRTVAMIASVAFGITIALLYVLDAPSGLSLAAAIGGGGAVAIIWMLASRPGGGEPGA